MLETVSRGFKAARNRLAGRKEITEEGIAEAVRDIRVALLEADVDFTVAKTFVNRVKEKALGEVVKTSAKAKGGNKVQVSPSDHFIKICHDELEALMGPVEPGLDYAKKGPTKIMMVGLQGSGKTTTTAKLANKLIKEGHTPLLVAADVYRPAAVDQLQQLGARLEVPVFAEAGTPPPELCQKAVEVAKKQGRDVILFDTAGRLAIDEEMMHELEEVKARTSPENILLVCDAMIGQDAVRTADAFNKRLELTGFVMTKLDGDARGGAALSIKEVTGKPIKFLGMGESLDKLEDFRPEGLASRILGFGDIVGLMQDFEAHVDEEEAEKDAEKILSGDFDLDDFVKQIKTIQKMGSLSDLLEKFPLFGDLPEGFQNRRPGAGPGGGDGRLHDPPGALEARAHRRLAHQAHRRRLGDQGGRRQGPPRALPGDARPLPQDRPHGRRRSPLAPPGDAQPRRPQAAQGPRGRARRPLRPWGRDAGPGDARAGRRR